MGLFSSSERKEITFGEKEIEIRKVRVDAFVKEFQSRDQVEKRKRAKYYHVYVDNLWYDAMKRGEVRLYENRNNWFLSEYNRHSSLWRELHAITLVMPTKYRYYNEFLMERYIILFGQYKCVSILMSILPNDVVRYTQQILTELFYDNIINISSDALLEVCKRLSLYL